MADHRSGHYIYLRVCFFRWWPPEQVPFMRPVCLSVVFPLLLYDEYKLSSERRRGGEGGGQFSRIAYEWVIATMYNINWTFPQPNIVTNSNHNSSGRSNNHTKSSSGNNRSITYRMFGQKVIWHYLLHPMNELNVLWEGEGLFHPLNTLFWIDPNCHVARATDPPLDDRSLGGKITSTRRNARQMGR